jgi:UDP:flavonoid glycosyltransferase YjiC (YdhE family)
MVPLISAVRRRDAEVLVIGPPSLRDTVESAGFDFLRGEEPDEPSVAPIRNRLPTSPAHEASVLANRELFGHLATSAMLPEMERAFESWKPDLVLREPCEYASAVVALQASTPIAQVAISLAQVENESIGVTEPALEEHRTGLTEEVRAMRYLSRFPPSLDPSPFPLTIRYREVSPRSPVPLADWWNGSAQPLVYVTFGTVLGHMSDAVKVYRTALRAVADLDVRVLLTTGRKLDLAELGPIPHNVHVESFVEQDDVLGQARLVVCHAGSGTTLGALSSGVPIVAVPLFADQFANAKQLVAVGAAIVAHPLDERFLIGDESIQPLRDAIVLALEESSYRAAARKIAKEVADALSADEIVDTLIAGAD